MSVLFQLMFWMLVVGPCALAGRDFVSRNLHTIEQIYNLTLYPNFLPILQNGSAAVPPGLFSPNVSGRISPLGNFTGFEESIEYFFSLAPVPQGTNGNAFYRADTVEFTSGCPEVAASVTYLAVGPVDPVSGGLINSTNATTTAVKQIAFWSFDGEGRVKAYDAWLPNLQLWTATLLGRDLTNRTIQDAFRDALCPVIQQRCTGPNQQYDDVDDCLDTLRQKPFGTYDEVWGDNIACRTIHAILTQTRPGVHCPHVGRNGGNGPDNYKCVDIDYSLEYFADQKLYGEAEGVPFTCPERAYPGRHW
ncbi:hypothetical protein MPH_11571 [Macrophomina phaseolina MS6]|uniref:Uncharacterized protein n=1 Tax=Macrophomina phaseolina (strain MS6) TaxID=1126212 RepID=K2QN05_MACPH|nr:hypothetical protein MPH_11571 [Macrophomina phaseolina MS6]